MAELAILTKQNSLPDLWGWVWSTRTFRPSFCTSSQLTNLLWSPLLSQTPWAWLPWLLEPDYPGFWAWLLWLLSLTTWAWLLWILEPDYPDFWAWLPWLLEPDYPDYFENYFCSLASIACQLVNVTRLLAAKTWLQPVWPHPDTTSLVINHYLQKCLPAVRMFCEGWRTYTPQSVDKKSPNCLQREDLTVTCKISFKWDTLSHQSIKFKIAW